MRSRSAHPRAEWRSRRCCCRLCPRAFRPRSTWCCLPEIFRPRCTLPLREAQDKEAPEPGAVYYAPPGYHLLVEQGPYLALSVDAAVHFARPSIDVLFESAADVYRERLLGIIPEA